MSETNLVKASAILTPIIMSDDGYRCSRKKKELELVSTFFLSLIFPFSTLKKFRCKYNIFNSTAHNLRQV